MGQEVGHLHIVVGLPGSGKSTFLEKHFQVEHPGVLVFDDYQANALAGHPDPQWSRNRVAAIEALRLGESVIISDVNYCRASALERITDLMREDVPGIDITVVYFANDSRAAEHNVRLRGREGLRRELELVEKLSKSYEPPGETIPITRETPPPDDTPSD